jgi:cAMP phosphodiesterase
MNLEEDKNIGFIIGIKFNCMTVYRAELIHLKNDGKKSRDISIILDVPITTIDNLFNKSSQPKENIINKLEALYLERKNMNIDFKFIERQAHLLGLRY